MWRAGRGGWGGGESVITLNLYFIWRKLACITLWPWHACLGARLQIVKWTNIYTTVKRLSQASHRLTANHEEWATVYTMVHYSLMVRLWIFNCIVNLYRIVDCHRGLQETTKEQRRGWGSRHIATQVRLESDLRTLRTCLSSIYIYILAFLRIFILRWKVLFLEHNFECNVRKAGTLQEELCSSL